MRTDTDDSEMLTVGQAAALLQVSKNSIRSWTRAGRLPVWRPGPDMATLRYPRSELEKMIKSQTRKAA